MCRPKIASDISILRNKSIENYWLLILVNWKWQRKRILSRIFPEPYPNVTNNEKHVLLTFHIISCIFYINSPLFCVNVNFSFPLRTDSRNITKKSQKFVGFLRDFSFNSFVCWCEPLVLDKNCPFVFTENILEDVNYIGVTIKSFL